MMAKQRLNISLGDMATKRLEALTRLAKLNGSKISNKSIILETLILEKDPLEHARSRAKHHQQKVMEWTDKINIMEEQVDKTKNLKLKHF
ncbi:MAG TPA: hypothetical protein ENI23_15510 [bacterium]|nr:hypothetical protein [bacterium]